MSIPKDLIAATKALYRYAVGVIWAEGGSALLFRHAGSEQHPVSAGPAG